jgi:PmbA protein
MDDGSFGEPIRTAMVAGNAFEMLRSIGGIGDDDRVIGSMILPSIRLNGQRIVGT